MIKLFKTGFVDYPEEIADKPVKYREEDLQRVAMATNSVELTDEHTKEVIGILENFTYKDGYLYANEPEGINIKGLGISPSFKYVLKDMGDYYVPKNIELINAGLTKTPRSQIFYNSIEPRDDSMGNIEEKEKLLKDIQANQDEIRNQREEIGILRNRNKALDESLKNKNELESKLKDRDERISKLESELESIKSDADAYNKIKQEKRDKIISELSNGDEELEKEYGKMSLEQLEFWSEKNLLNTKARGVGSHEGDVDDGTHFDNGSDEDKPATYEDYLKFKKEQGLR